MKLKQSWKITKCYLEDAVRLLPSNVKPNPEGGSVEIYREYLDYNELELALDELEGLGEFNKCSDEFWECLLSASKQMNLENHQKRYLTKLNK